MRIYDIQYTQDPDGNSPYANQTVTTGGLVTGIQFGGQPIRYFISDRTGGLWTGILVNDLQNRNLAIGDSVRFQAEVQESSGQTRLRNVSNFAAVPAAGQVPPTVATTGSIGEAAEGVLVELQHVGVTSVGANSFVVNDGSGPATIGDGWNFQLVPQVGETLSYLRGVVSYASGVFEVNPRNDLDFGTTGNRPPVISNVWRYPENPTDQQSDTVTAFITDEGSIVGAFIHCRFGESGEFLSQPMHDDGLHGDGTAGDGRWGGVIPAGPARTMAYFYVAATDDAGDTGVSPVDAPENTYSYLIRSTVLTIFDLQYSGNPTGGASNYVGQRHTVTGIVTGTQFDNQRRDFFMSDPGGGPWTGILVFGPSYTPAVGDCVQVNAQLQEYYELTEFSGSPQVTVLGSGRVPEPMEIPIGILPDSAEAYEGSLVRIGPCVVTNTEDWMSFQQFDVRGAEGTGTILGDFGLDYEPASGDSFTFIQGCVSFHSAVGWMVAPRSEADLGLIDRRPPELRAVVTASPREINISFNENLSPAGVDDVQNYRVVDQTDPSFPELHVAAAYLFTTGRTIHVEFMETFENGHAYRIEIAEVSDVAGNVLANSAVTFGSWEPGEYASMEQIYNRYTDFDSALVTLRGVVTFVQDVTTTSGSRRISAFMQDESYRVIDGDTIRFGFSLSQTGAASTFPGIQRGNVIEITGRVSIYQGALQLGEFTGASVSVIAEDVPMPTPVVVKTGDRRHQQRIVRTSEPGTYGSGTWVETTGAVRAVDENVGGGTNIQIDDGSGNVVIRLWDSMNLDSVTLAGRGYRMRDLVGKRVTIAGPASTYNGDFQMLAGYADDFRAPGDGFGMDPSTTLSLEIMNGPLNGPLSAQNRPFAPDLGQTLTIRLNAPADAEVRLRVFDLRGHLVTTLWDNPAGGAQVLEWDGRDDLNQLLPLGTYILHLETVHNGRTDSKVKPVVIGTRL